MADTIMTLSYTERRTVQELRAVGQKLFWAKQVNHTAHVLSAAVAYMRSLAASALEKDPYDITRKQIASVMREVHQDIVLLGGLHLDMASCLACEQALEIADLMLRVDCTCCMQDRMKLAARSYFFLMEGAFPAGNIMEACKVKWIVDRLDSKALPFLANAGIKTPGYKSVQQSMGSICDIMDAFRSIKGLVDIPDAWKRCLEASPEAPCWYPAHIGCQDTKLLSQAAFQGAVQSILINCGTYNLLPLFVVRHFRGGNFVYSIHTCRLEEKEGKMDISCLRVLKPRKARLTLGAVCGSMLYLTAFVKPTYGALLGVDLSKPDVEPTTTMLEAPLESGKREVDTMVALGGDLYVYGGTREMQDGEDDILSDILVARAKDGIVNQPWKRLAVRGADHPPRRVEFCLFGHKSPEGRLSLYLFGGMQITAGTRNDVDGPVHDLWKLDIATRRWSEPEQRGTRPCARMISHGCGPFCRGLPEPGWPKALIAGGCTAFGCEHFEMRRCAQDYHMVPLPDLFELDLNTTCWVQIVPKGRRWTSAFKSCGGGYLASNHIGLTGLTRFAKSPHPSVPIELPSASDWTTAVNIRVQRGKDPIADILASDRHGFERDRVVESIAKAKLEQLSRPLVAQDRCTLTLLQMDRGLHACTVLTQHLDTVALFGYTPMQKDYYKRPEVFGSLLKGKQEVITNVEERLAFQFTEPWVHSTLCPFNPGPHWLGGYNEVSTGIKLTTQPSKKQQASGGPWIDSMYHAVRSLPSPRAAVEYFRLMLPPWKAKGEKAADWMKMSFAAEWAPPEFSETVILAYRPKAASSRRQEFFPLYVMAVTGSLFSAMLLVMKAPKAARNVDPSSSWPYHAANLQAISDFHCTTMLACLEGAGLSYQCSYCGRGWNSNADSSRQKPKVCQCQMATYCSYDCQYRHWAVHKPICKAARQPGGITQEQALAFMLPWPCGPSV